MSGEIYFKDDKGAMHLVGKLPTVVTPTPTPTPTADLQDNFDAPVYSLTDGQTSPNGLWKCLYAGGGTIKTAPRSAGGNYMYLAPKAATASNQTYGATVMTTKMYTDFDMTLDVVTLKQLRTGSPANNWEVAWLNWCRSNSLTDLTELRFHAYAFTAKIDGWQLEKKDNEQQDDTAEIYLVTNNTPDIRIGTWQKWRIKVTGTATGTPTIQVWVDGVQLCNYVDNKPPLNSEKMKRQGPIVLYTEDAAVGFDNVKIQSL